MGKWRGPWTSSPGAVVICGQALPSADGSDTMLPGWPRGHSHSVNRPGCGRIANVATKKRTGHNPTAPLVKAPVRIGKLDVAAEIGELRALHEKAGDPRVERMPDDAELYGALLYLEQNQDALKPLGEAARKEAAIKRTRLWEYLREQADIHQLRAIDDARAAKAQWSDLAAALAVKAASAAYNKAVRLRSSAPRGSKPDSEPVRRTPEAILGAERRIEAAARAERRREQKEEARHALMKSVARRLLDHKAELARDNTDAEDWLEEITNVLADCVTPVQKASLATYVSATVRSVQPASVSADAQAALAAAAELSK